MAGSAIVAARKKARDGLEAVFDGDPEMTVTYAWNPESSDKRQIFTMRAEGQTPPASLRSGRTFRNEDARFRVVVHVDEPGASPEEADEIALEYGTAVEEFFADNRTPDVPGLNWWVVDSWEMTGGPTGQSSISQLIYTIHYDARLT